MSSYPQLPRRRSQWLGAVVVMVAVALGLGLHRPRSAGADKIYLPISLTIEGRPTAKHSRLFEWRAVSYEADAPARTLAAWYSATLGQQHWQEIESRDDPDGGAHTQRFVRDGWELRVRTKAGKAAVGAVDLLLSRMGRTSEPDGR
jgi:hypothetical protein